jgi:predicted nucleic acid-binding protein
MRVAFDTNVLLDVFLARRPFVRDSALLVDQVALGRLDGMVVATSVTTIDYVVRKATNGDAAHGAIYSLLERFEVAQVDGSVLRDALAANWRDFEDAVLHEAAKAARAEVIVTRNVRDFGEASLRVLTPTELLAELGAS